MRPFQMKFADYKSSVVELKGGINENVSSLELGAGELIDCKNYMIAEGGYGGYVSVKGYERFDGATLPSLYTSINLTLEDCSVEVLEGQLMTGDTSSATMMSLEDGFILSGSYAGGDALVEVQVLIVTGTTELLEDITTVSGTVGSVSIIEYITGGTDDEHLGIQYARENIVEVPGEGNILGLHIFEQKVYAFRKKTGIAFIGMYVEDSTVGWVEVDTSASPLVYSGVYDFKFTNYNFLATSGSFSMFWTDGVNKCRAYDGTTVTVIDNVGMTTDSPINVVAHNNHLFLAYIGGSLQFSQLGDPTVWDGTLGASEIGLGDEITNLIAGVQGTLLIFLQEGIRILSGNSVDDFVLDTHSRVSGGFINSAQRLLGTVFFVNDRGLTTIEAVQEYGDYASNSISQKFKDTLLSNRDSITTTATSRDLNQYRIFFENNSSIFVSFEGRELKGATLIEYPIQVSISAQGRGSNLEDVVIFSTNDSNGYVYKMDSGTSFDGTNIITRMTTSFFHYGSPRQLKAFKTATFEISIDEDQEFYVRTDFDYNELGSVKTVWYTPHLYTTVGDAIYGSSMWGTMIYGAAVAVTNRLYIYLQGVGTNMSYKLISNETYKKQHIVQNIITDYEPIGRRV